MKQLSSISSPIMLLAALGSFNNDVGKVPQAVKTTVNNQYPTASKISREKEESGSYF